MSLRGGYLSLFITFEGVEGSGKTSQIRRLHKYLAKLGIPGVVVTREPGGPPISEKIRKILLDPAHREMAALTELLLYEAARSQHVKEVIAPALKRGGVVICDRFTDASVAYQGFGRRVDIKLIARLNRISSQKITPDVTFLLDCPSCVGLERALRRNRKFKQEREGRFELEKGSFHDRIRRGYLAIAKKEPRRLRVVDTRQGEERVFETVRGVVDQLIKTRVIKGHRVPS